MSFKLFLGRLGLGLFHLIDDMILLNAEAIKDPNRTVYLNRNVKK